MGPNMPAVSTSVVCEEPTSTTISSSNSNNCTLATSPNSGATNNGANTNTNNNNNNNNHHAAVASSCSSAIRDSLAVAARLDQSLHTNAVKRTLDLTKVEYERAPISFHSTTGETLKKKYTVLKAPATPDSNHINSNGMGASSSASATQNGTSAGGCQLPVPKSCLYKRELVEIGWKQAGGRRWDVGSGMTNMGNTCYLNSTLQALFHVPAFANWLYSDEEHRLKCEQTNSQTECIICAMARTLYDTQSNIHPVKPNRVYSKLRQICRHLMHGHQEDAHEFLRYLVEAMEKAYLLRFKNSKEFDQMTKETTPLNQILGGYLKSSVRCMQCGHVSVTFQHFQDLLLDIRKSSSIEDALDTHFARERLEDMGYKCEACKKKVSATKQFSMERAPIALCIQLKRFSMMGSKLNKHITFGTRLNLSKYSSKRQAGGGGGNDPQMMYRLVSMVTHLGSSQHCGHYTAVGLASSGNYYTFDDSSVRAIGQHNVVETNAYIMFYELEDATAMHGNAMPGNDVQSLAPVGKLALVSNGKRETPASNGGTAAFIGPVMVPELKQKAPPSAADTKTTASAALLVTPTPQSNGNGHGSTKLTSKLVLPISQSAPALYKWSNNSKMIPPSVRQASAATSNGNNHVTTTANGHSASNGSNPKHMTSPHKLQTTATSTSNNHNGRPHQAPAPALPCMPNLDFSTEPQRHSNQPTTPPLISSSKTANHNHKTTATSTTATPPSSPEAVAAKIVKLVPYANSSDEEGSEKVLTKAGVFEVSSSLSPASSTGSASSGAGHKRNHTNAFAVVGSSLSSPDSSTSSAADGGNGIVNKLKRMSHSGYGAPVNSWSGQASNMEQECKDDRMHEQRRRQAIDVDADMDVGRQRKAKPPASGSSASSVSAASNPEYNPFQGTQDSINHGTHRWTAPFMRKHKPQQHHHGNGNGGARHRFNQQHQQHHQRPVNANTYNQRPRQ